MNFLCAVYTSCMQYCTLLHGRTDKPITDLAKSTSKRKLHLKLLTAVYFALVQQRELSKPPEKFCKDQLSLTNPRATRCITANVLQNKVDAQCDNLAAELS